MEALSVKNLSFSYTKDKKTLDDISFIIERGSYVSLLGHNGSGKSTLAKLLVGLLPFAKGEIKISGVQLNKDNLSQIRNKISIVFQNPDNQFIGITVEDDIAFSLENRNVPKSEMDVLVREYAEKVGMLEFLNKEPAYLSGGQKQRVAVADALVIKPEILILDEATSMLDPKGKREILSLINDMRKENPDLTVISITHDIEEAYLSDRVILLDNGHLVADLAPNKLFNNLELVNKYHLDIPFEIKLKEALKKEGYDIKENMSIKDMEEEICPSK